MERIELCNGYKITVIREPTGAIAGAKCTYCTASYTRRDKLIKHCNSAHKECEQISVSNHVNALHAADNEAEKQRLAALAATEAAEAEKQRLVALKEAEEAEKYRLVALAATEAAEAEKQRLAAMHAIVAEEAEKTRFDALHAAAEAAEAEKQRLTTLRDKQRVLHAEVEKQRIIAMHALKEADEAEKQRLAALHAIEAEEAEKKRLTALHAIEAEEAEKQRKIAFEAEEAEKLYIKELQTLVADKLKLCDDNDLDIDGIFTLETRNTDFLRAVDFFKNRMGRRKTERHIRRAIMDIKVAMRAKITKSSTNPSKNKTMRIKIR